MSPGVIVLAPPWPRTGSGNIIAAQTAAHARRGARVLLLLTPMDRGHRRSKAGFWQDAVRAMAFPGVERVAYPRLGSARVRSFVDWALAGCDDAIAIVARYAAAGRLPPEFAAFARSARIELIHANHVFSMRLARRIAGIVHAMQGRRPRILLDTHDIQSQVFVRRVNALSGRIDSYDDLLRTELALSSHADVLVHLTQSDFDFFSGRLPRKAHELILPTLHPDTEAQLVERRGAQQRVDFDFVYLGNNHEANLETVRWLLREVFPLASPGVRERVRFIGKIDVLMERHEPALFQRYRPLFLGEVSSVFDFYRAARVILAPARAGTGTSIKLIEALCVGKPVLTTALALRGLPSGQLLGDGLQVHDAAGDLAAAMTELCEDGGGQAPVQAPGNARLYDRLFSNRRYFAALDGVVEGLAGHAAPRAEAPPALLAASPSTP